MIPRACVAMIFVCVCFDGRGGQNATFTLCPWNSITLRVSKGFKKARKYSSTFKHIYFDDPQRISFHFYISDSLLRKGTEEM
jgi:hypothetical protein